MDKLENWLEVTKGLYRYVIAAHVYYEIHINYWYHDTNILTANASLFIVVNWTDVPSGNSFFSRECLLNRGTVRECLIACCEDNEENNS